jgi:hypothetical protein
MAHNEFYRQLVWCNATSPQARRHLPNTHTSAGAVCKMQFDACLPKFHTLFLSALGLTDPFGCIQDDPFGEDLR